MNESQENLEAADELPKAKVKRSRWRFPVVWVVPAIAAIVAGYLVYGRLEQLGPKITIRFKDGNGLKTGQTPIKYRGVQIGEVTAVELSPDQQAAVVRARLQRSAASIAKEGAVFWVCRPGKRARRVRRKGAENYSDYPAARIVAAGFACLLPRRRGGYDTTV
jgi:paraquat-inducible protein B